MTFNSRFFLKSTCLAFTLFSSFFCAEEMSLLPRRESERRLPYRTDLIAYAEYANDPTMVEWFKENYDGLANPQKVDALLKEENYTEVLHHLWSEADHARRLEWLDQKVEEGHAILLYELAVESIELSDDSSLTLLPTIGWLTAAFQRTILDVMCSSDPSLSKSPGDLIAVYEKRLEKRVIDVLGERAEEEIKKIIENEQNLVFENPDLLLDVLRPIVKRSLHPFLAEDSLIPSPEWLFLHGRGYWMSEKNKIDKSQYDAIRRENTQQFWNQLNRK